MTAPVSPSQPSCATPPDDLRMLADEIELCRDRFLNAFGSDDANLEFRRKQLAEILWNDKGTFAPALRQAAEAATLKARAEQAERAVDVLESNARVQAKLLADTGRRVEALEAALRFIADGYDNHDVNHVDFRVKAYQVALDALEALPKQEPGQ